MGDSLLAGIAGGLQGVAQGLQWRRQKQEQDLQSQYLTLSKLFEQGDEETRRIAAEGLAEIAERGVKYKGNHLEQIRERMMPAVMAGAGPGPTPAGPGAAAIGQPPSMMPPPGSAAPPPATVQPPQIATMAPGAAAGTAALPSTSPTAKVGQAAGQPPGPPVPGAAARAPQQPQLAGQAESELFSAESPEAVGAQAVRVMKGAGIERPQPPDEAAIAKQIAQSFGFTPEQIQSPAFTSVGGLRSPERERIRQEYQRQLVQATGTASSEYKGATADYARSVMAYLGQVGAITRAETGAAAAESRQAKAELGREQRYRTTQAGIETRAEAAAKRDAERQARQEWNKEVAQAEHEARKLRNTTDPMVKLQLKRDPGLADRLVAEARASADERYRQLTGQEPPGSQQLAAKPGESAGKAQGALVKTAGPLAAPPVTTGAPAGKLGAPPKAPLSQAEVTRASQIRAKANRAGIEAITPEERAFMRDYQARGGQ
jgi:hypothetical protein